MSAVGKRPQPRRPYGCCGSLHDPPDNGAVGNFVDRIHLLCYRYDAAKGIYTERITVVLGYAAGATLLLLLSGLSVLLMRERRKAAP